MKIFSWMQSKLSGSSKSNTNTLPPKNYRVHETSKEEFSDWPSGLLTIGTFGNNNNNNLKDSDYQNSKVPGGICQRNEGHFEEITNEELRKLQKELKLITNSTAHSDFGEESLRNGLQAEKLLDFLQNLEDERSTSNNLESSSAVCNKGTDENLNKKKKICKRSLTFLLKRAFHRTTGKFKLNTPPLGDPIREMKLEKSRLEKILRTILKKKVYPQNSGPHAPSVNKILDQKHQPDSDSDDDASDGGSEGSKWVKTDSDYIVLEI